MTSPRLIINKLSVPGRRVTISRFTPFSSVQPPTLRNKNNNSFLKPMLLRAHAWCTMRTPVTVPLQARARGQKAPLSQLLGSKSSQGSEYYLLPAACAAPRTHGVFFFKPVLWAPFAMTTCCGRATKAQSCIRITAILPTNGQFLVALH